MLAGMCILLRSQGLLRCVFVACAFTRKPRRCWALTGLRASPKSHSGETRVTRTESDSTQGAGEDKAPSSSAQQSTRSGSTCPASIDPVPVWDTKKNPSSIDPNRFGALVLNPNAGEGTRLVVVDPALGKHLKEHQKEAVLWVYRMLFGGGEQPGRQGPEPGKRLGVILAHEMGLGKTLTAIALFTTVLEQSPEDTTYGEVQKIIVTAPLSNCHQWILEIAKWLGHYKVKVCWVKTKEDAEHFRKSAKDQVMVVSHSSFVKLAPVSILQSHWVKCPKSVRV